ncbi:hypothetical protein Isop_0032 [Isosphaera pallida ATCC 43644]|uniref:Uncharacterized protein n=1 Tax=Isosphaera pallida (strain ATCC 43644 / DSM 9630 / IS1B) TaxID=575540 RepID=E8R4N8_ISOPI|nr:hypothetical protein Isop_0032 [Isosphaera pallida ATCC 43644]
MIDGTRRFRDGGGEGFPSLPTSIGLQRFGNGWMFFAASKPVATLPFRP